MTTMAIPPHNEVASRAFLTTLSKIIKTKTMAKVKRLKTKGDILSPRDLFPRTTQETETTTELAQSIR